MRTALRRGLRWLPLLLLAGLLVAAAAGSAWRPPPPLPNAAGTFTFGALGDAPYEFPDGVQYRAVLEDMAAHDLSMVAHLGDLFARACRDELYASRAAELDALPHPVVYTPGDNEWTDCWSQGGFDPLDRLALIRTTFFPTPGRSLGRRHLEMAHQDADSAFADYVENVRWVHGDVVFAAVHIVGSANGTRRERGDEAEEAESVRRTRAAAAWVRQAFAVARESEAAAVVLLFHAAPPLDERPGSPGRAPFEPFLTTLEEEAARWGAPVLLVHGDDHVYTVDHPLSAPDGATLPNVTRLEVPGSPTVGWVRVIVEPGAPEPFSFEPRIVPPLKLW